MIYSGERQLSPKEMTRSHPLRLETNEEYGRLAGDMVWALFMQMYNSTIEQYI